MYVIFVNMHGYFFFFFLDRVRFFVCFLGVFFGTSQWEDTEMSKILSFN